MKFSIIIPTYNHLEDCLKPCIESVLQYTDTTETEILVVANGCTDGTKEYLTTKPQVKVLWFDEALGYTRATNEGIVKSTGDYIILLNNDCILLEQNTQDWINILYKPFITENKVGITGVSKLFCPHANRKFLIFFCVMIFRKLFNEIGLLDEIFSPGGGEDTDFCIKAENKGYILRQVPEEQKEWSYATGFPIYHKAEGTFATIPNWQQIFDRNSAILKDRYDIQKVYGNNFERAVIDNQQQIPPRENSRYQWAKKNLVGKKVLEIGCSSGYGLRVLKDIPGLDYLGIDYDQKIVDFATSQFGPYFKHADINTFNFEQYDTIIAFEVLEHIKNGKEVAQKLKQHCKCLLATCPYDETPGFWGEHHVLHHLKQEDFPGFTYYFMDDNGNIADKPHNTAINLMLMKWGVPIINSIGYNDVISFDMGVKPPTVAAYVSSKDRYFTTLPMVLSAICNQTVKPQSIKIFMDGEHIDLRENSIYKNLFLLMEQKNIQWFVVYALKKGQVLNHHYMTHNADTEFVWRVDDDTIPEPNVLETLLKTIQKNKRIGAVGGLVIEPGNKDMVPPNAENNIKNITAPNIQWFRHPDKTIKSVDHIYSTFLYRKEAAKHGYCLELSPVGHREETIFTYEMKLKGWELLVDTSAVTWHAREPTGGIRSYTNIEYYKHDEDIFNKKMEYWGATKEKIKYIVLDCGLGDHWAFKNILPEIQEKYKDFKIVIGLCYPEVFDDVQNIEIMSIENIKKYVPDINNFNVYKYCAERAWTKHIIEAFKEIYL